MFGWQHCGGMCVNKTPTTNQTTRLLGLLQRHSQMAVVAAWHRSHFTPSIRFLLFTLWRRLNVAFEFGLHTHTHTHTGPRRHVCACCVPCAAGCGLTPLKPRSAALVYHSKVEIPLGSVLCDPLPTFLTLVILALHFWGPSWIWMHFHPVARGLSLAGARWVGG